MDGNQIEKLFWGKVPIHSAVAFLQFHKDSLVMNLMHALKYKGKQEVGEVLGKMAAGELRNTEFLNGVDFIVPVPLHTSKFKKRGYNQCSSICKGISELTAIPVLEHALIRTRANPSQTRKSRFDRYKNTDELFITSPELAPNSIILLVDDVVTTGSTLESCVKPLLAEKCEVRVFTLAAPID